LNDKIYKLSTDGRDYYIPLWHTEVTYDVSGNDLILQCVPELPDNIFLDNYNNIHITVKTSIQSLLINSMFNFSIGEKVFEIPGKELKIMKKQTYIMKNKGMLVAQYDDLYDISKRGDIYIYINLE
jgi:hypothetical protein